jgi:Flp pilus assembly pilin Flp
VTASRFDTSFAEALPLDAAEGRCNHMTIRDLLELARIELRREEGQTMAEYGVVLAVITLGVILAIGALAVAISGRMGAVTGILDKATGA